MDVEPSIAGAFEQPDRFAPLLHQPVVGEVNGRSEAIGSITRALRESGLKATFFIETLHPAYFGEAPMGRVVEDLKREGQDVQLHVHPCWLTFRDGRPDMANFVIDECAEHSQAELADFLGRGSDQLERWSGERPVAMRTGGYSTSRAVFRAMTQTALRVSSNICIAYAPPEEAALRAPGGVLDVEGVFDFPVTCFRDRGPLGRGRFRILQITACATWELRALLEEAHRKEYPYVVVVTHPFEFVKRDSYRYEKMTANRINQNRFRWLCSYLQQNSDRFGVTTMAELARSQPQKLGEPLEELSNTPVASVLRTAQNALNDRIWSL